VSKGKWTLFVPNDDAFDDLGNTLDDLSNDDAKKLILFHFVKGKVLHAEELPCTTGDNLSEMANGIDTRTLMNMVPLDRKEEVILTVQLVSSKSILKHALVWLILLTRFCYIQNCKGSASMHISEISLTKCTQ
jgi:hypothetical protein